MNEETSIYIYTNESQNTETRKGDASYPTDSPTVTRLGLCSSLIKLALHMLVINEVHVYSKVIDCTKYESCSVSCKMTMLSSRATQIDGLVQERHKSIANALELRLSCTGPSRWKDKQADAIYIIATPGCEFNILVNETPTGCSWSFPASVSDFTSWFINHLSPLAHELVNSTQNLTPGPLGDMALISNVYFSNLLHRVVAWELSVNFLGMVQDITTEKSIRVQIMAWCHQPTSHYKSHCWHSSMLP